MLATLLRAVRRCQAVKFAYRSRLSADSVREVDVYRAAQFGGSWYAVGHCHARRALRCFRLDRISALSVLDATFTPPEHFDALEYLRASLPTTPESQPISVWLGAKTSEVRGRISDWGTELTEEGGGTRLRAQREQLEPFAAMLLGLGCEIRIEKPTQLHQVFAALAERCRALAARTIRSACQKALNLAQPARVEQHPARRQVQQRRSRLDVVRGGQGGELARIVLAVNRQDLVVELALERLGEHQLQALAVGAIVLGQQHEGPVMVVRFQSWLTRSA